MTEDYEAPDIALTAEPFKVGIMPTVDGNKVVLVLRADQTDQMIYWLDSSTAIALSEVLLTTACRIEDEGTAEPFTKN